MAYIVALRRSIVKCCASIRRCIVKPRGNMPGLSARTPWYVAVTFEMYMREKKSMNDARQTVGHHTKSASSNSRAFCMISTDHRHYYVRMINEPENVCLEASEN